MTDKTLVRRRFTRSIKDYDREASVQRAMAEKLLKILKLRGGFAPRRVLEIGCGTGIFTRLLLEEYPSVGELEAIDLVPECGRFLGGGGRVRFVAGDAEILPFSGRFDLVVSSAAVQWIGDFPVFAQKISDALERGGIFAFSTFGKDNLAALRRASGTGLAGFSEEDLNTILNPYFNSFALSREQRRIQFSSPLAALRHLKATGVTASGGNGIWTKGKLAELLARFGEKQLIYDCIYYGGIKL